VFRDFFAQQSGALGPATPIRRRYLSHDHILELHTAAVNIGLTSRRDVLLCGVDPTIAEQLREAVDPSNQTLWDLEALNQIERLRTGEVPLAIWLSNADALSGARIEANVFRRALAVVRSP
jgi:hypothetical protein